MDKLSDQRIADFVRLGTVIKGDPNMPGNSHIRGPDMTALVAYVRTLSHDASEVPAVHLRPDA